MTLSDLDKIDIMFATYKDSLLKTGHWKKQDKIIALG